MHRYAYIGLLSFNQRVVGSNPAGLTIFFNDLEKYLRWIVAMGFRWGSNDAVFIALDCDLGNLNSRRIPNITD